MKKPKNFLQLLLIISLSIFCTQCKGPKIEEPPCVTFDEIEIDSTLIDGGTFLVTGLIARTDDWPTDGYVKVDSNNYVGTGQNIRIFNINLHKDLIEPISRFSFDFAELGGVNKIMVNGTFHNFADFPELQNIVIDQVGFSVNATQFGNNWVGDITARGPIENFAIGGQELWIDNLCGNRFDVLLENRRDDPLNNPVNPDGGLTQYNHLRELLTERGFYYTEKINDGTPLTLLSLNEFDLYVWYISPVSSVSEQELSVIEEYVSNGGSILILTESGNQLQVDLIEALFNIFGATHEGNTIQHPTSNFNNWPSHVIYHAENILDDSVKTGVSNIYMPTASSVSGTNDSWLTILESDAAATPSNRPLIIRRSYQEGKVMITGDFNFMMGEPVNVNDGNLDNDIFVKNLLYFLVE